MIFSNEPDQIELERIMTQPPFYRPRGHGKYVIKTLLPDKESCNCGYCLYADRKKKCTLTKCPYIEEGITAGSVSRTEALIESVRGIHNAAFRKRFNCVLMKREEGEMHGFRGEIHRSVFLKAIEKISPDNKVALSALYLLTADGILWKQVSRFVDGSHISFEKIRIMNSTTDTYALFCVAKDFSIGTKHISLAEVADEDIIREEIFLLICWAMLLRRYGYNASLCRYEPNTVEMGKSNPCV